MKFLCTAVVLLAAASKTSASFFELVSHSDPVPEPAKPKAPVPPSSSSSFGIVSPSSQPKKESSREGVISLETYQRLQRQRQEQEPGSQPQVGSSGSSYSSSSSGSSMASRPVPALSPKPALRENDLAALKQAKKQEGEVEGEEEEEQPGSVVSSSSPSSSSSMPSSTSSKQLQPDPPVYMKLALAVKNKNAVELRKLLSVAPFKAREEALGHLVPSRGNANLVFELFMSMKNEIDPSDFKKYAVFLLPRLQGQQHKELSAIISASTVSSSSSPSSSSSSSSSMSSSTSSKRLSPDQLAYSNIYGAIQSNNVGEVRRLVKITPIYLRQMVFNASNAPGREQAMFEILMSLKGHIYPFEFREKANELLPHLKGENKKTLEAILSDKSDASLSTVQGGPEDVDYYYRLAQRDLDDAIFNNHAEEVRALLPVTPFVIRSTVFAKSDPSRNSGLLFEVLMSMKKELDPSDFNEDAQKLLLHLSPEKRAQLFA